MHRMVFVSLFAAAVTLIGCQGSKQEKTEPFVPMPPDMEIKPPAPLKEATPAADTGTKAVPPASK